MKICKKCKEPKTSDNFSIDRRSKDGLWRYCRECESIRKKQQRLRQNSLPKLSTLTGLTNIVVSTTGLFNWIKAVGFCPRPGDIGVLKSCFDNSTMCGTHVSPFIHLDRSDKRSIITLNWKGLLWAEIPDHDFKMDLHNMEKKVVNTLFHECMHEIIQQDHGLMPSCQYDNIYRKLRSEGYLA